MKKFRYLLNIFAKIKDYKEKINKQITIKTKTKNKIKK